MTVGNELVGIISERDYARKVILLGRASRDTLVREVMSAPVITVSIDDTVATCLAHMTERRVRHLPVMGDGQLVGVVSIGDLVKAIIDAERAPQRTLGQLRVRTLTLAPRPTPL